MSLPEAAAQLGINRGNLGRYCREGRVRDAYLIASTWLIRIPANGEIKVPRQLAWKSRRART